MHVIAIQCRPIHQLISILQNIKVFSNANSYKFIYCFRDWKSLNQIDLTCVVVFLIGVFRPTGDVAIAGEGLQILTCTRHSWPLSSEGSSVCHTYCDISEIPRHSHLLPSVWQWRSHYLFLWLKSVAAEIRTPNLPFARRTF